MFSLNVVAAHRNRCRNRVAVLADRCPEELEKLLCRSADNLISPAIAEDESLCRQIVHPSYGKGVDLFLPLPVITNISDDAGSYIDMEMCCATHLIQASPHPLLIVFLN